MNNELLLRYYYYQDSLLLRYHDSYTPLKGSIEESLFLRKEYSYNTINTHDLSWVLESCILIKNTWESWVLLDENNSTTFIVGER